MISWDLKNGDIVFRNGVLTVRGTEKIVQDLETVLMNDRGFNRFHPWMGSTLDSRVGSLPRESDLYEIKRSAEKVLAEYYYALLDDLRVRTREFGSMEKAIALSDPGSIVSEVPRAEVKMAEGRIVVSVTFRTLYNEKGSMNVELRGT